MLFKGRLNYINQLFLFSTYKYFLHQIFEKTMISVWSIERLFGNLQSWFYKISCVFFKFRVVDNNGSPMLYQFPHNCNDWRCVRISVSKASIWRNVFMPHCWAEEVKNLVSGGSCNSAHSGLRADIEVCQSLCVTNYFQNCWNFWSIIYILNFNKVINVPGFQFYDTSVGSSGIYKGRRGGGLGLGPPPKKNINGNWFCIGPRERRYSMGGFDWAPAKLKFCIDFSNQLLHTIALYTPLVARSLLNFLVLR